MVRRLLVIAWVAFLAACALELLVFAWVDPADLRLTGEPLGWSHQAVHTVAFLVFWATTAAACLVVQLLYSDSR